MFRKLVVGLLVWAIGFSFGLAFYRSKPFPYHALRDFYQAYLKPAPQTKKWRTDFFEDTTGRMRVDCPTDALVFLAIGQSGAANRISSFRERDAERRAYQFFDGQCYFIEDPMLGATGTQGSLWSGLAQDISAMTGNDVVFINGAVGGSSLADWIRDDSVYFERVEHQILLAKDLGYEVKLVFWYNGAREAELGTTADQYADRFQQLMDKFDFLFDDRGMSQWVVFQTSKCWHVPEGSADVRRGQQLAAERSERVTMGLNTDSFDDRYRWDGCHLNHNAKVLINKRLKEIILSWLNATR